LRNKVSIGVLAVAFGLITIINNIPAANGKSNLPNPTKQSIEATEPKVALVVSEPKKVKVNKLQLKKYKNAHSLTDHELVELLKAVGFKGEALETAWAVAKAESNGRPFAFNGNTKTGDNSYGIFQINMIGQLGPDRREKFNLKHNADLFNPVVNAKIAYYMSQGGKDWRAWKYAKTPSAIKWRKEFPG
jgi:hypothetical protein